MQPSDLTSAFRDRQARLAAWLARSEEHACVIEDFESQRNPNLRWLCGHPMDALLFVFASGDTVLVPWDVNMAEQWSVVGKIIPYTEFKRSFREAVSSVLRGHGMEAAVAGPGARRRVEFPRTTSHMRFLELKEDLPGADIIVRSDGFESFTGKARAIKDATEIRSLEKAADVTNAILDTITTMLTRPGGADGVREIDMAQLIQREAVSHGAEGTGFETLAAGPGRSWGIHAFPSSSAAAFATQGLSILDFGVVIDGYTSDVTLTVARGSLSDGQETMVRLVTEAYETAVQMAQPGVTPQALGARVEQIFSAAGHAMPHSLGHGIGIETHETPVLRSHGDMSDPPLSAGMVFTIEPGLYDPLHGGVRWENDVLITEKGARVLTRATIIRIP